MYAATATPAESRFRSTLAVAAQQKPTPPGCLGETLHASHYNPRTEQAHCHRVKGFISFHHDRHPAELGELGINVPLTDPAGQKKVSASTQEQNHSASIRLPADSVYADCINQVA